MTHEVRLFAGMSAFGIGVGVAYWFLTYDATGTVLLGLFGVAAGIAGIGAWVGSGGRGRARPPHAEEAARPSTPTVAGPWTSRARIARRVGSASAANVASRRSDGVIDNSSVQ